MFFWLGSIFFSLATAATSWALPLSPGDRISVSIPNETYFARTYEVNQNGAIEIPLLGDMAVAGLEPTEVKTQLSSLLIDEDYFLSDNLQLTVEISKWSAVQVSVAGEVFQPGRVLINKKKESDTITVAPESLHITGNHPVKRYLTNTIGAAGGVLPTANVKEVRLIRDGQEKIIN